MKKKLIICDHQVTRMLVKKINIKLRFKLVYLCIIQYIDEGRHIEEERESSLREVDEAEHMSPCLQRYWRRRNEEYKEEQFYL